MRRSIVLLSLALLAAGPVFAAEEGAAAPAAPETGAASQTTPASQTSGGAATGAAPAAGAVGTTAGAVGFFGLIAAGLFVAADNDDGTTQHAAPSHH